MQMALQRQHQIQAAHQRLTQLKEHAEAWEKISELIATGLSQCGEVPTGSVEYLLVKFAEAYLHQVHVYRQDEANEMAIIQKFLGAEVEPKIVS